MPRGITELGEQELGMAFPVHQSRASIIGEDQPQQIALLRRCRCKILSEAEDADGRLVPGQQIEAGIDQVGGIVTLGIQDIPQCGTYRLGGRGLEPERVLTGQCEEVLTLSRSQLERFRESSHCLC
jgi:hypothetical protein